MTSMHPPPAIVAPARNGDIAIEEEFLEVKENATLEAYDLFIERHPGHPLAAVARVAREDLRKVK